MFKSMTQFYKNTNVMVNWLISYGIILLIPMITSSFLYVKTSTIVENMAVNSNTAMLNNIQQALDTRLLEAKKLSVQIAFHPNINGLRIEDPADLESKWHFFGGFTKNIAAYTASNVFIQDFYIYLHNTDVILKPSGSTYSKYLYEYAHEGSSFSFAQWEAMLRGRHTNTFLSLPSRNGEGVMNNNIAYVTSILKDGVSEPFATIVVIMRQPEFFTALSNITTDSRNSVFIIDDTNTILASNNQVAMLSGLKYDKLSENRGQLKEKINSEVVVLSYAASEVANWRYVCLVPQSLLLEKTEYIKRITLITTLLYLALGVWIAFFLAKKNYTPLAEIVGRIYANAEKRPPEEKNEYRLIASTITNTMAENQKITDNLERQKRPLRQNFIARLIKGRPTTMSADEMFSAYNMHIQSNLFSILVFYIEDLTMMFDGVKKEATTQDVDLVFFAIQNIIEEFANEKHGGFVVDIDGMIVCLVNASAIGDTEFKSDLTALARRAKSTIERVLYIRLTVAVGSVESGLENIGTSYENALYAMEHRVMNRLGEIIEFDGLQEVAYDNSINYTLDMEYQFINYIKIGNLKKAKLLLNDIIDGAFSRSISISMARCLMFDIVSTMLKAANELSIICDPRFLESLNPIENLTRCKTFDALKEEIVLILECIGEYIDAGKKSHNVDLKDNIKTYVEERYWDADLSIAAIAQAFEMNPDYLSRFYKEQTGEGLLDFIHKIRVGHAKALLAKENYSVNDAAAEVGFYNSTALIRAFKKYEGITPGQYREGFRLQQ